MNRHERRTRGKQIVIRLNILKNSPLIKDADLSSLPPDVIESLTKGSCENKDMQRKYNACQRILGEIIELEAELQRAKSDYEAKRRK